MSLEKKINSMKHKAPTFLTGLWLMMGAFSLPVIPLQPLQAAPLKTEQAQEIAKNLQKKFKALGPFEAYYTAISPDGQTADITLIYNPGRQYILAQVDMSEDSRKWLVLDYSTLQSPSQAFRIWLVTPDWKQRFEISISQLRTQLSNPLGAAFLLAQKLPQGPSDQQLKEALQPSSVLLSLGLNATDLQLVMGISTAEGPLQSSWLSEEVFREASDYEQTDRQVTLKYPNARSISIDTSSGLLQRDRWPDPQRPGPREIKLERFGTLTQDLPYRELLPNLNKLPEGELPTETFAQSLYPLFLTELAHALKESNALESLGADVPATQALLLKAFRQHIRSAGLVDVKSSESKAYFQQLRSIYARHQAQQQTDLRFEDFVQDMRASASDSQGNYSQILLPPGFSETLTKMQADTRQALQQMPESARASLAPVLDVGMPKLWEALLLETLNAYLDAALIQAKSQK